MANRKYTEGLQIVNPGLIVAAISGLDNQPMVDTGTALLELLNAELKRRGLSRAALAAFSQRDEGPSRTAIYKWFKTGNISDANLRWIADITGIDYDRLWLAKHGRAMPDFNLGNDFLLIRDGEGPGRTVRPNEVLSARAADAARQLDALPPALADRIYDLLDELTRAMSDRLHRISDAGDISK